MTPPSTVVFDLGKVLVDFDYGIAVRRLADRSAVSAERVKALIDGSELLARYETGQVDTAGFFSRFHAAAQFRGTLEDFGGLFADIFQPIEPMVALHAGLRSAGVRTFILSNTNDLAVSHIRRSYPFFSTFDGYVLSYEHGSMKPDAHLYRVAERLAGARGPDIVYLDDRAENVETALTLGWRALVHRDAPSTFTQLATLGLPVPSGAPLDPGGF